MHYEPGRGSVVSNDGSHISVRPRSEYDWGTVDLPGGEYSATEIIFHFPSEHRLDYHQYTGEMQIIHEAIDGQTAIVSLFLSDRDTSNSDGKPDALFKELEFWKSNEGKNVSE